MKSGISCFNRGVSRDLLHRFWPLWVGYGVLLLFLLPVQLARASSWMDEAVALNLQRMTLQGGEAMVWISFFMAILTAMVVFGYLYNSRSCGLMNSLPIRRETMFLTAWLTGLWPMLAADLLTALLTGALYLGRGLLLRDLLAWLLTALGTNLAFYGIAAFCAMLTGSLLMLPVAYLALNLAAWAAEGCLRTLLRALVYGINTQGNSWFTWLSPVIWMSGEVYMGRSLPDLEWQLFGLGWVAVYAALGIVLSALALLLYRKRQMECAGDTVAFPVLKPIFRYCMALGGALVLASSVYSLILGGSFHGRRAAFLILGLLLLGAALGWYIAEMLIRRSVRVFPGKWRGLAVVCALLCLLTLAAEYDLTGFERRVPDPAELEKVSILLPEPAELHEPENLRRVTQLHRDLVEHKEIHEGEIHYYGEWIRLRYEMKDGSSLERAYFLQCYESPEPEDVDNWEELLNCHELLDQRDLVPVSVTEKTFYAAQLSYVHSDPSGWEMVDARNLTMEEALDFYYSAVLPDRLAYTLGRRWLRGDGRRLDVLSNVSFHMDLLQTGSGGGERMYYLDLEIGMDSEACLAWIREHTDIPIQTLRELNAPMA